MNRKIMIAVLGLACAGLAVGCVLHTRKAQQEQSCTKELFAMDTYMDFTAYGRNCEQAVDAAIAKVKELDALLSTGDETSEISRLNAAGSLEVSADTSEILKKAEDIYEKTNGVFDFTIYPVMKLWGFPTQEYHVAAEAELSEILPLVDASKVQLTEENGTDLVTLGEGQEVDFGGIAKGYTAEKIMEIFREYGVTSGMISLGGNIQVLNTKPDGTKWNIGVRNPDGGQTDAIVSVALDNKAMVTSGGYERYFEEDGETYIHIIDPETGCPVKGDLRSVTIISEDGTLADALSTSLYIMGLSEACEYWRSYKDEFDAVLITDKNEIYITEGIEADFQNISCTGEVQVVR